MYTAIRTLAVALAAVLVGCSKQPVEYQAPLFKNLGDYSVEVTTSSSDAQKFFDQGVIMANAFNHLEAERSFREAARLDSTCAMAWWGIAYVLGPNYNTSSNLGDLQEIQNAVSQAVHLR